MTFISGTSKICEEIANALGFSAVASLSLDIKAGEAVSVTVKKYVTVDQMKELGFVLSRYKIEATPVEQTEEPR